MSIVVTGGAGFIGSAIVNELNNQGWNNIIIVDHLGTSEKWRNLTPLKFVDYIERDDFLELLNNDKLCVGSIIHMGACSSTLEKDASYLIKNNFEYTKQLAKYAIHKDIDFVYASSCATYGDGSNGYDDTIDITKLRPLNMYGYSKQLFDLYAQRSGIQNKIIGCKFSNVFGPNEYHKDQMRSVILKGCERINSTGKMPLFKSYNPDYGDGEFKRDFLYVKDAAKIIVHLLHQLHTKKTTGLFNVGSGYAESWNNLAKYIFEALNKPVNIQYIDMPEQLKNTYQYYTKANTTKLQIIGQWNVSPTPLKDAVKDYIQNYIIKGNKVLGYDR